MGYVLFCNISIRMHPNRTQLNPHVDEPLARVSRPSADPSYSSSETQAGSGRPLSAAEGHLYTVRVADRHVMKQDENLPFC